MLICVKFAKAWDESFFLSFVEAIGCLKNLGGRESYIGTHNLLLNRNIRACFFAFMFKAHFFISEGNIFTKVALLAFVFLSQHAV